jgi:hypothetical protein
MPPFLENILRIRRSRAGGFIFVFTTPTNTTKK